MKVMALTTISIFIVLAGIFLISISHDEEFLDLAFEATSAFGTVGLSRGATGELDGFGRAVIIAIMFLGRVGPLTLGFSLRPTAGHGCGIPKAMCISAKHTLEFAAFHRRGAAVSCSWRNFAPLLVEPASGLERPARSE